MSRNVRASLLLAALCACPLSSIRAEEFYSERFGFRFEVPAGWVRIPDDVLQAAKSALIQPSQQPAILWEAAYQQSPSGGWMTYPYLIVQVNPYRENWGTGQLTEDQIAEAVRVITGADVKPALEKAGTEAARSMVGSTSISGVHYDSSTHRLQWGMSSDVAMVGRIKGDMSCQFGRSALACLNFYALESDGDRHAAAASDLASSFRFDPASAYDSSLNRNPFTWLQSPVMRTGLIGGVVGGLCAAVFRRNKAGARPHERRL